MGARAPGTKDRRVQRTRRTLRDALISLLVERGFDAITVQDVCARADVGRSTFYLHFTDKEDLLTSGFEDLRRVLREETTGSGSSPSPLRFARGLIEHAYANQRLFRALVGKRSGTRVLRLFRDLVIRLVREDLGSVSRDGPPAESKVRFIAGGFVELITWALEEKAPPEPGDLESLFVRMAAPALEVRTGRRRPA